MKKIKIRNKISLLVLLVAFLLPTLTNVQAYATELDTVHKIYEVSIDNSNPMRAEEIEYHYAVDSEGRLYYRIWSITRGKWITDWILVG